MPSIQKIDISIEEKIAFEVSKKNACQKFKREKGRHSLISAEQLSNLFELWVYSESQIIFILILSLFTLSIHI